MILSTTLDAIRNAIAVFDADYRGHIGWHDWEKRRSQKYALLHDGKIYPPKKIVALATGLDVNSFYGGRPTNSLLETHGFTIQRLHTEVAISTPEIPGFQIGESYSRKSEITGKFGGSAQSGIAPSARTPSIFIFTGESGEEFGYSDHFDENGNLFYVGAGQEHDMVMSHGNLAITRHAQNGRALHAFKSIGKGKYKYLGEFFYDSHELKRGPDKKGVDREIIVFYLVPVGATLTVEQPSPSECKPNKKATSLPLDLATLRAAAIAATIASAGAPGAAALKVRNRTFYERSEEVKNYVIARADGSCELCDKAAPFQKLDGTPYLEPHHINRLSDGGLDHPLYVGAICPTCHRHIHYGEGGAALNDELRERVLDKEAEISISIVDVAPSKL